MPLLPNILQGKGTQTPSLSFTRFTLSPSTFGGSVTLSEGHTLHQPPGGRTFPPVPSTASGHVSRAQPSRRPGNVGLEQAGDWLEVTHLTAAAPGQTVPVPAERLPAAGPPCPGLHAASSCQPPANAAGPQQPSNKLLFAPGAPSLDFCCLQWT